MTPRYNADAGETGTRLLHAVLAAGPSLAVASVVMVATLQASDWYETLVLPSFAPPLVLLGPLWVVADLLIGWGFYRVLRRPDWMPDRPGAIRAFAIQLALNALWPSVLFIAHSPATGLLALALLVLASIVSGRRFGLVDRRAGLYGMVYVIWAAFMALIDLSIVIRT